ncbi:hypothetical protein HAZELMIKA_81 [Klebsiella phage vB_KaeD_HazelMika]|nr:hypothetical protein HAZELMIKA_81 [Klebsiella phage vB_KaeD_HazelMika]
MINKPKYLKIKITANQSRFDADSLTLEECGVKLDEVFYADVFSAGHANIRAKRDNEDKSILAGDNLSVERGEYEVIE